ncbi:MAG: hypothetical protein A3C79_01085 [Candidatus Taylorbacteria bacterium RIFCSPHIGHO2_02_FULL_45_28]|uniref:Uncharacterized protein n=1 Tax=Candidatus Taylorbacteria bacterium RIFCSPHIGHO2_12_FULL_45_16 TaxID=1802315 RepID=A0A1G2MZK1_9BACT|nr:MAG: hypothetical protein A2830_02335 [Candidatus Taylorbacteria bacterium RIFCSPHIGHO2_01_FULL_44_110]OHA25614.1 MAG: hypothetical protein A3C79_01085 [Candidatus Taylorbacteria bacterium RIFCSPHIGHO2_02_FULL_45_28]OHA29280.1 MAG: hypothetical protein A3F51_01550 [Candidatus Taylorbacteria bacterium RIFCSPHIGHO2_12_FULL_45_16]OHA33502.1 MAG: hypothetical protein A3A23_02430 [Candidatus Taylorbacteria bacterium RIFCSPLOWO2_01_FULL_45_59]OHA39126.1 MAG: hypothetical protein A3I98_00775 [Candi
MKAYIRNGIRFTFYNIYVNLFLDDFDSDAAWASLPLRAVRQMFAAAVYGTDHIFGYGRLLFPVWPRVLRSAAVWFPSVYSATPL